MFRHLFFIFVMLNLSSCWWSEPEQRAPASSTDENDPEFIARKNSVENFVRDNVNDPNIRDGIERELKRAFLSDPSLDSGEAPTLSSEDLAYAQQARDLGVISQDKDAAAAAREIGKLGAGLLDGKTIQFSPKPEFRCSSIPDDPKIAISEILIAKAVYSMVTYVRYRPHTGLDPGGGSDFVSVMSGGDTSLQYDSAVTDDPDNLIRFSINSTLNADEGSKSTATLSGKIKGISVEMNFSCERGEPNL